MTKAETKAGHKRPEFLVRQEKGVFQVRGTEIRVLADGKGWKVEGVEELAKETFATRHAATERIEQMGLVPAQPAEAQPEPKPEERKVTESTQGVGGRKATGERKPRPRTRKQPAKAGAATA